MSRSAAFGFHVSTVCLEDLPGKLDRPLRLPGWSVQQRGDRRQFKISSLNAVKPNLQCHSITDGEREEKRVRERKWLREHLEEQGRRKTVWSNHGAAPSAPPASQTSLTRK